MKNIFVFGILLSMLGAGCSSPSAALDLSAKRGSGTIALTSSAFAQLAAIPKKYTCDGDSVNPPLHIQNVPQDAATLVLLLDDPDANASGRNHWAIYNLPPNVDRIGEGEIPPGMTAKNSASDAAYSGPCPPSGTHSYHFKLFALDTQLALPADAAETDIEQAMQRHILEKTELIGTYTKQ